jgi:large subunit ribosomal protein L25
MTSSEIPQVQADPRDRLGSRHAYRLRCDGRMPAVIYGHKKDPLHISVETKPMLGLLHQNAHVFEIDINGQSETCLIKDIQWDYLGTTVMHLDLTRIDLTEQVRVEIDLELTGEAVGLKEAGAFLAQAVTRIEVECLATEIPENITVDISDLQADQALTLQQVAFPQGVTCALDPNTILASITISVAPDEDEEEATGEAEPEVIGGKPEDSEEGSGEESKKD